MKTLGWARGWALAAAMAAVAMLAGCDRGDSPAARDHSGEAAAATAARPAIKPHGPAPMIDGKPVWADNRKHTAEENLDYQFQTWGAGMGAKDAKDYARRARTFLDHPPAGVEKVTRGNGDVLYYDKKTNTFAIARRDGAPRLFRKPPGGAADWAKAKEEAKSSPGQGGGGGRRYHAPSAGDYRSGGAD